MSIISRDLAHIWSLDNDDLDYWISASIHSVIYEAISNQKFHCDWYSPARYDATESRSVIYACSESIRALGYNVTVTEFEPNEEFPNLRIKLHINWE